MLLQNYINVRTYSRQRKHQVLYPERQRARNLVYKAIKLGALIRPDICDADYDGDDCMGQIEAAHYDYNEPLRIRWLCSFHHREWDKARRHGTM